MKPITLLDKINKVCSPIPTDFSEENCWSWMEEVKKEIPIDLQYTSGISKLVILPENEDYVLKIPFLGKFEDVWHDNEDYQVSPESEEYDPNLAGYEVFEFIPFEGAAVNQEDEEWDYCATETSICELAEMEGLEEYFAHEELLGFIKGDHPVYIQDRVEPFSEEGYDYNSDHRAFYGAPTVWIEHFINQYGEQEFERLADFLVSYEINHDFHRGNLGYIQSIQSKPVPIILDYSDFHC